MPLVIFLHGPIGAGKTTLGHALASRRSAPFIDGDDLSESAQTWLRSIRRTSNRILKAALEAAEVRDVVVVGYPLRRREWLFFRGHLHRCNVATLFVGLTASADALASPARGRVLNSDERARTREMLAQGYGAWPFSDLTIDTGTCSAADACRTIECAIAGLTSTALFAMPPPS